MDDLETIDILGVTTTVGTEADARRIARGLVEARLAACVQIDAGITSVYRWEGRVCEEAEWRLVIKTVPDRLPALEAYLREHHPYELPQLVVARLRGSDAYARWVASSTLT